MSELPASILAQLVAYRDNRCPCSPFLADVLAEDWRAIKRATPEEAALVPAIKQWLYDSVPFVAFGSHKAVRAWLTPPDDLWQTVTTLQAMGAAASGVAA